MKIEIKSKDCLYVTMKGKVYYIDESTGEGIVERWKEDDDWRVLPLAPGKSHEFPSVEILSPRTPTPAQKEISCPNNIQN
ncbi:MAG TPA: hypothetical protein DHW20_01780 [Gemmatimonadetes bacterium]|nr:hypothetical protein [Gemmatimonadota bacterium]|tara:strand:+ start:14138 stop:14377 length:240 start_codon:yes stop_codon:yes gene_type:complete